MLFLLEIAALDVLVSNPGKSISTSLGDISMKSPLTNMVVLVCINARKFKIYHAIAEREGRHAISLIV